MVYARELLKKNVAELVKIAGDSERADIVSFFSASGGGGSSSSSGAGGRAASEAFAAVIRRGAPLFNSGQPDMCSALYLQCITEQVAALEKNTAQASAAQPLKKALDEAARKDKHKD